MKTWLGNVGTHREGCERNLSEVSTYTQTCSDCLFLKAYLWNEKWEKFISRTLERDSKTVTICFLASQAFRFCWVCNASNALGECEIIFSWFLYVLQRLSIGDATIMLSKIMSIFTILCSKRVFKTKKWNMARILLIPGLSSQLRRAYKINQSSSDLPKIFFLWVHGGIAITRCFTLFLSGRLSAHEILMTQSFYHIWEQYFFLWLWGYSRRF